MEFLVSLLLIGVLALLAANVRLAVRVGGLERRIGQLQGPGVPVSVDLLKQPRPLAKSAPAAPPREALPSAAPSIAGVIESLVGGRLLIWVGGAALVVAAVLLIRFSIEIGLVTPELRMLAAAAFGLALLGGGEAARASRLRDDPRISQALVGAGLAVLYATVYGSYILYGFLGLGLASALMLGVTLGALGLALRHGQGTAALGMIGGFLTPWLVGESDAGVLPLLGYLALLDAAVFAIAARRNWDWLAGLAVLASFAWSAVLMAGSPGDAAAAGWFAVLLAVLVSFIGKAGGLSWLQPLGIAAVLTAVVVSRGDVDAIGWLQFGIVATASVARGRLRPHGEWLPVFVLQVALLMLSIKTMMSDELVTTAAIGMTALFGAGGVALALERRRSAWIALACTGCGGPAATLWVMWNSLLMPASWGLLFALLAIGPALLLLPRRAADEAERPPEPFALLPALATTALLTLALYQLIGEDLLSLAWLGLAIVAIAAGIRLPERSLRLAGLVLLTVTVLKVFLLDAAALEGVLRILSFLGLGAALIVLGRYYGTLLRAEGGLRAST